jgi:hypothetical protein
MTRISTRRHDAACKAWRRGKSFISTAIVLAVGLTGGRTFANASDQVQFNRDVLPILSANCFACHGPDAESRQAELRFDIRQGAVDAGAIVPGSAADSELIRRINSQDEWEVMPPHESKKSLTSDQRAILARWIDEGASYEKHWSFVVPRKAPLPEPVDEAWRRNPIDRYVAVRLEDSAAKPSNEAKRETLIRRVSLDLTGLPPSASEVEAFVADPSPDVYEELVDQLLASPHYGERMALDWLDAARYADTNGYSIDGGRTMWLWRDWVIRAFNDNMPYNQFLIEQLAGDLLPHHNDAQLIATGLQRNNMVTHEGGTIPEENLTNYNVDRVKTFGEAVLGLTLGCAQCHDHKYDPLSQRDYYRLFAYFNTASDVGLDGDGGINPRPTAMLKSVLATDTNKELQAQIQRLQALLANPPRHLLAAWQRRMIIELAWRGQNFAMHPVELLKVSTPNSGAGFEIENNALVISDPPHMAAYDVLARLPKLDQPITGFRFVFSRGAHTPANGLGYGLPPGVKPLKQSNVSSPGTFILTSVSLSSDKVPSDQVNLNRMLSIEKVTASSWLEAFRPEHVLDMRNHNGWSPAVSTGKHSWLTTTLARPIVGKDVPFATIQLNFGYGHSQLAEHCEIYAVTGQDDGTNLPDDVLLILQVPSEKRTVAQIGRLTRYFSDHSDEMSSVRVDLANAQERLAARTEAFPTMIMDESNEPRDTFILARGDYLQPTEKVEPGVPAFLPPLPPAAPSNRLGLAEWVVMPENPLTARVAVNRIWRLFFGTGIVATSADFGAQGEWPSHPELLDWLAIDFQESGWDVKRLVRMIVTSAAYRQNSATTAEALAVDPDNRLLARGPRLRLPAEFIRDGTLKTSGLLVDWIGGPSVNPYLPGDLWREVSHYGSTPATAQTFVQDHGEKLYRRSLYTYWKRTMPPPNLTAFDAPNREVCSVSRSITTTPMQALVLLNDVQFVEAARNFAERIVYVDSADEARMKWAFRECLSRDPSKKEMGVVQGLLDRERLRYAAKPDLALDLLANGESPRDESIAPTEHAAWTQVAALMLNLNETITRN